MSKKNANYTVVCTINNHCVLCWQLRSITQVCKFVDEIDLNYLNVDIIRDQPYKRIDAESLLEVWKGIRK